MYAKRRIRKGIESMRLINADRLKEDVKRRFGILEEVEEVIDAQPTAYDVDKVANDLEKYAYSFDWCKRYGGCPYEGSDKIGCDTCAVLGALEIAKCGGLA